MTTRAKFRVETRKEHSWNSDKPGNVDNVTINLTPVYSDKEGENKDFWQATPSGSIELSIDNVPAAKLFTTGAEIYVDFSVVPIEEIIEEAVKV